MLSNLLGKQVKSAPAVARSFYLRSPNVIRRLFSSQASNGRQLFIPTRPLIFRQGLLLVADTPVTSFYRFCILSGGILIGLMLYSINKLTFRFKDRKWYGIIVYAALIFISGFALHQCNRALHDVIIKVWLQSCGTKATFQRGFFWNKKQVVDIHHISLPSSIPPDFFGNQMGVVGFPVQIEGEFVIVPRTMNKIEPELFSAIFNGVEVCVESPENEIIIE